MMFILKLTFYRQNKFNFSGLAAGILAAIGVLSGIAPEISHRQKSISGNNRVLAQAYTPEEINNYARAGFQVEMLRQQVYQEIKTIVNEPPPEIICDRPETMRNIPANIRGIANNYCNRSNQIVRDNNLSIQRFNQLKNHYDRRGNFYEQVQEQLLNLQN